MNKTVNPYIEKEQNMLRQAIESLTKATGARIKILGTEIPDGKKRIDARIGVQFRAGQEEFKVEIKGEVRAGILPALLEQFGTEKAHWLFVSQYIPGPTKKQFRQNGMNYLEVTGNCFINTGQLYLFINDREVKQARQTEEGKLWTTSGLKLLFVMLQDITLTGATYRKLSEVAGIALGSISPLLEEMQQEGWRDEQEWTRGQPFHLLRERLAMRWAEIFPVVLQPRLKIGTFRFLSASGDWPKQLPEGTQWGGEPAGELYTQQLVPETFTLYTDQPASELVKKLRIVPDENGNIKVYRKFWRDSPMLTIVPGAVPPLLAYADLRNSNDSRAWEIAEKIRKDYVAG